MSCRPPLPRQQREGTRQDRRFITARPVGRVPGSLPGKGFFDLARTLSRGLGDGETELSFHARELEELARNLTGEIVHLA